jgi:hypothetical protein
MLGLAWEPATGTLYETGFATAPSFHDALFRIDPRTGRATEIGSTGPRHNITGLAYDWVHDILYGVDTNKIELVALDRATGFATTVGPLGWPGPQYIFTALAFDGQTLWGDECLDKISAYESLISINPVTGRGTEVGSRAPFRNTQGMEFVPVTVPEPWAVWLLAAGLGLWRRRGGRVFPFRAPGSIDPTGVRESLSATLGASRAANGGG